MATKKRSAVPRAVRDKVLKEFNHRCAICGADNPQVHHIDADPSNNEPLNLVPLCPNCHLGDHHDPTKSVDPGILALFRRHRDPSILSPQFRPLFLRLQFLEDIDRFEGAEQIERAVEELLDFVAALEMGSFYSRRIGDLLNKPKHAHFVVLGNEQSELEFRRSIQRENGEYIEQVKANGKNATALIIELLRFQQWDHRDNAD